MAALVYFVGPKYVLSFCVNEHDARFKASRGTSRRGGYEIAGVLIPACACARRGDKSPPLGLARHDKILRGILVEGERYWHLLFANGCGKIGLEPRHRGNDDPSPGRNLARLIFVPPCRVQ